MVRINKVYTRTGDQGETSLVGGRRLVKDHVRIESYGTTDELNTVIGIVRTLAATEPPSESWDRFIAILQALQQKLFDIGSELATHHEDLYQGQITAVQADVDWLERLIDMVNKTLPSLKSFVLPGGNLMNAHLHQARTICRRAERLVIRLSREEPVNPVLRKFLNRLSDLLFVLARWVSFELNLPETLWQPQATLPDWTG